MKTTTLITFLALLIGSVTSSQVFAQGDSQPIRHCGTPDPPPMVEIFQHSDFRGANTPIPADWTVYNWDDYWNDKISSIMIPEGFEVTIFEHAHFQGRSMTLTGNWTVCAWDDFWNDRISSIQIRRVQQWGYRY